MASLPDHLGFDSTESYSQALRRIKMRGWGVANSKHKKGELALPFQTTCSSLVLANATLTTGTNQRIVVGVVLIAVLATLSLYTVVIVTFIQS